MATKAVFAIKAVDPNLDIQIEGSGATIHCWWLNVTLIMSAVFGFAEHSLCVAWAATFRGERWIEMSHYAGTQYDRRAEGQGTPALGQATEPLLQNEVTSADGSMYP